MSLYTNQNMIENVLQRNLTTEEEAIISQVIEAVSKTINEYTGRRWFDIDTTADDYSTEAHVYDGNGKREIFTDDFTSVTTVKFLDYLGNVSQTVPSTSYTTLPNNADWKNSIYFRDRSAPYLRNSVEVTALFYTGEVPTEIKLATASLAGYYLASDRNIGEFKKESIEGYSYEILAGKEKIDQDMAVLSKIDYWRKVQI